jgi:hypothetical protein
MCYEETKKTAKTKIVKCLGIRFLKLEFNFYFVHEFHGLTL